MKRYRRSVVIFRRDLRVQDNTALNEALTHSDEVVPCFILDSRQLTPHPYRSVPALQFMLESLQDLDKQLKNVGGKLYVLEGIAEDVVASLIDSHDVKAVFCNRDYTPFSQSRDKRIRQECVKRNAEFSLYADALLTEPEQVSKDDGKPYTIFTPFCRKARTIPVHKPTALQDGKFCTKQIKKESSIPEMSSLELQSWKTQSGGRAEGLKELKKIKNLNNYDKDRNIPSMRGTSKLSAHNKFGTLSIREVYQHIVKELGVSHTLITQLYWRDFFTHIAYHFPKVFEKSFQEKYDQISWKSNTSFFDAWCRGQTGFPIVDAGMRELNQTGWMHNRVRMITASFLVKDLHIDWREGEKYFAQHLVDYDPCVNNGSWQWAASTGCDAQPYFRIFNPWRQQERFDPDCDYIKKWVPELKSVDSKSIHKLDNQEVLGVHYPRPIVSHKERSQQAKAMFSSCKYV